MKEPKRLSKSEMPSSTGDAKTRLEGEGRPDGPGWWDSAIVDAAPNEIYIRGYSIQELMGRMSCGDTAYLMIMGELPPHPKIGGLLEALLVAVCDHGADSPAVAAAVMAASCGIPLNCVMATGMNLLGRIHGGPIEAAAHMFYHTADLIDRTGSPPEDVVRTVCLEYKNRGEYVPGFGHPTHDADPRVGRMFELVEEARAEGVVAGRYVELAKTFERILPKVFSKKSIRMNIDAGGAAMLCEVGIPAEVAMGFICMSRCLGLMAHGFETFMRKERMKTPMPPDLMRRHTTYSGPPRRTLPRGKLVKK